MLCTSLNKTFPSLYLCVSVHVSVCVCVVCASSTFYYLVTVIYRHTVVKLSSFSIFSSHNKDSNRYFYHVLLHFSEVLVPNKFTSLNVHLLYLK